jgi:hypothetical protein
LPREDVKNRRVVVASIIIGTTTLVLVNMKKVQVVNLLQEVVSHNIIGILKAALVYMKVVRVVRNLQKAVE